MKEAALRRLIILSSLLALGACTHYEEDKKVVVEQAKIDAQTVQGNVTENGMRVADNVRDAVKRTGEKVREWWLTPLPHPQKQAVPNSYCYRVMQDILCYRNQMPGWESKLVAYQGTSAEPPAAAITRPLPQNGSDVSNVPANRAANAKPVFVGMPADIKEPKADAENVTTIDSSHETLPDPALAPQL